MACCLQLVEARESASSAEASLRARILALGASEARKDAALRAAEDASRARVAELDDQVG